MSKHLTVTGSPELRKKAQSFKQGKTSSELKNFSDFEFSNLSSSPENVAQSQTRRFSLESLLQHINHVLDQIYQQDRLNLKATLKQFIDAHLSGLRGKLQQRLSLLKYLEQSLQYKNYSEIEVQIQKEWRRNALMFSISTIWARVMLESQFGIPEQFADEYEKYRRFVANISHFYFRNSLRLLDAKGVDTLSLLYDDSAHHIINTLKDWKEIYFTKWMTLLRIHPDCDLRRDFDMKELKINPQYLCVHSEQNQLVLTTQSIAMLSDECRIHEKVNILKKIRATFWTEITENCLKNSKSKSLRNISQQLEKDDILDCMVYCIIKGGIETIGCSLRAMMMLLGPNSQLLSRKGVDSYRADLQSSVQYLCQLERKNQRDHQDAQIQNQIHA